MTTLEVHAGRRPLAVAGAEVDRLWAKLRAELADQDARRLQGREPDGESRSTCARPSRSHQSASPSKERRQNEH